MGSPCLLSLISLAEAYFVCHIALIFQQISDLCLHWVSVVRALVRIDILTLITIALGIGIMLCNTGLKNKVKVAYILLRLFINLSKTV